MSGVPGRRITRADIEAKLVEIKGEVDETAERAKPLLMAVAVAGAIVLIGVAYVMGKRKGKRKTTVVEVRRV